MRRFFSVLFIALALVIGGTGIIPFAHTPGYEDYGFDAGAAAPTGGASSACSSVGAICTAPDGTQGTCATDPDTNGFYCIPSSLGTATASNPGASQAAANTGVDYKAGNNDEAYSEIMIQIMRLFAWLVGVAMLTLNYAVFFTVITMGEYVKNLSAVGLTWSILRDIGNIMLIFGFLMAGIMTILNVDWYGFGKKMLPMLLVAAVFLNFSLFISEAIVDTGNLFATQFYTQINGGTLPTAATVGNEGI